MDKLLKTAPILIILASLIFQQASCKPHQNKVINLMLNSKSDANLQQSKQFIGSSVIGGLMWPVLLTLTVTAIMARVPDVLQRLLTGPGGRKKRSLEKDEHLNRIMKMLLIALAKAEKMDLDSNVTNRHETNFSLHTQSLKRL